MEKNEKISTRALYGYVIGAAIGAGMFVTLPGAIGHTGKSVILAVILAAIVYFFNGFYQYSLSSLVPLGGSSYGYMSFLVSPTVSGVNGLTCLFWVLSNCVYATGAMEYIGVFVPAIKPYSGICAALLVTFFFAIDYIGTSLGAKVEGAMTIFLTICVLIFIGIGITKVNPVEFFTFTEEQPFFTNGFIGFSRALGLCIWVIGGVGGASLTFAKNVDKPTKTIPRCILICSIFIAVVGVLICYVCAGAVPTSEAVQGVSVVAKAILPSWFFPIFILGGAGFALLSTLQTYMLSYRVEITTHADDGFLPKFFTIRTKSGYPIVVGLLIWAASVIPCLTGMTIDTVTTYTGAPSYALAIYVNLKMMQIPKQYPELWAKSSFGKCPLWLFNGLCIFSAICSTYLAYCYIADFGLKDIAYLVLCVGIMIAWAVYRIKSGKANMNKITERKEEAIAEALAYAKEA